MTDLRKAAEMALKQLQRDVVYLGHRSKTRAGAINALRQALDDKPAVKSYCGGKLNYCVPLQSARIRIDPVTGDVSIGTVDAVNMSQESVDETAKGEHDLWIAAACLKSTVEAAIKAGDWKVDGACDPTMDLQYLANCFSSIQNREWVGLTDADKQEAFDETQEASGGFWEFADYLETKLKEKNT